MDQAGEVDARNVAGMGDTVPWMSQIDFCACGKCSVRNPPPFFFEKKPLNPHEFCGKYADVEDIDYQEIARLGTVDADRAAEEMHDAQVDVAHVGRGLVVLDEASGPVVALDDEIAPGFTVATIGMSGCHRLWIISFL
jgi:hypothetical protein